MNKKHVHSYLIDTSMSWFPVSKSNFLISLEVLNIGPLDCSKINFFFLA